MPLSMWFALVVLLIGLIAATVLPQFATDSHGVGVDKKDKRAMRVLILFLTFVASGLFVLNASFTQISARSVGVETSFGKPLMVKGEGLHMINPFHKVEKFDASTQTLVMEGDGAKAENADAPAVTVRLGNQTTAQVDVRRAQWNIDPKVSNEDMIELYRRYRQFDKIELNAVAGQIQNALVQVFGTYDPLAGVNGTQDAPLKTTDELSTEAKQKAQEALGGAIQLSNVLVFVRYDGTTQTKLNDYANALAATRIATQNGKTATENAAANRALTLGKDGRPDTSYKDPAVMYQNCLNLVADLASKDQLGKLPPGFTCTIPGTTSAGTSVLTQGGPR